MRHIDFYNKIRKVELDCILAIITLMKENNLNSIDIPHTTVENDGLMDDGSYIDDVIINIYSKYSDTIGVTLTKVNFDSRFGSDKPELSFTIDDGDIRDIYPSQLIDGQVIYVYDAVYFEIKRMMKSNK
jgi:hypothetical protein